MDSDGIFGGDEPYDAVCECFGGVLFVGGGEGYGGVELFVERSFGYMQLQSTHPLIEAVRRVALRAILISSPQIGTECRGRRCHYIGFVLVRGNGRGIDDQPVFGVHSPLSFVVTACGEYQCRGDCQ